MTPTPPQRRRGLYPRDGPRQAPGPPRARGGLGAPGSIGRQPLDVVARHPDRLRVCAVSCHARLAELEDLLAGLASRQDGPMPLVAVTDPAAHAAAAGKGSFGDRLLPAGRDALGNLIRAAERAQVVVNGLVGAVGLAPTLAAAERGLRIALANKESLVVGGDLVHRAVAASGAEILPVDSEHSAIAQCLSGRKDEEIRRLILTASGGPFRTMPAAGLAGVTRAQVLDHPTWKMGPKITVDSASLMNKGLEVIEAHHLFGLPYEAIDVVVHPGSIVHSLVEFVDGAVLAQLGTPDMRVPLQYAIGGERHWPLETAALDLVSAGPLQFELPDLERFPCLRLAREAGRAGGGAPIVLNAANEVAVAALLADRLQFVDIPGIIASCLERIDPGPVADLESALAIDHRTRREAEALVAARRP